MLHEYQCQDCHYIIEVRESQNEVTEMSCIKCRKVMARIFSIASFILSGVGCYGRGRI